MLPVGGFQKGERILKVVALNLCCFFIQLLFIATVCLSGENIVILHPVLYALCTCNTITSQFFALLSRDKCVVRIKLLITLENSIL